MERGFDEGIRSESIEAGVGADQLSVLEHLDNIAPVGGAVAPVRGKIVFHDKVFPPVDRDRKFVQIVVVSDLSSVVRIAAFPPVAVRLATIAPGVLL